MSTTAILILLLVAIYIGLTIGLGHFLTLLHRDDPSTFDEVATPEEVHLGQSGFYFLGHQKFLLFHIIPKSYEVWGLTAESMRYADRFRIATIVGTLCECGLVLYLLISTVF